IARPCAGFPYTTLFRSHIGQLPSSGRTISGCIGQVYSVLRSGRGFSRSSAIPHLGQGPDLLARTSGHIGQTYSAPELEGADFARSEEHTSELQSLAYLV